MTQRYSVSYQGRRIGLAFVSSHPMHQGHIVVSVVPLSRKGKWQDNSASVQFENPLHDIFPDSMPEDKAVMETIVQAAIEPWKVELIKVDQW